MSVNQLHPIHICRQSRQYKGFSDIPDDLIKEIARCLVPDIIAFFETKEAKREFEAWKTKPKKSETSQHLNDPT